MFDPLAFDQLLGTAELGSRLQWAQARRCPCVDPEGGVLVTCAVCGGQGFVWDGWSDEFRAGLLGLSGRQLEGLSQRWGPGAVGDATMSLPASAAPYGTVTIHDRFIALDTVEVFEWTLAPNVPVKLPVNALLLEARTKSNDGSKLITVSVPVPDANGRVMVNVGTALRLQAPRRFDVIADLSQVRGWMLGLPKKIMLKLVDTSVRW